MYFVSHRIGRMALRCVLLLLGWISFCWLPVNAQSVEDLNPALLTHDVTLVSGADILYLNETAEIKLSADAAWAQRSRFKPYGKTAIDFGYLAHPVWVILRVKNNNPRPQLGTISIGRPELKIAEIHLVSETGIEQLYSSQTDSSYRQRFRDYLALAETAPFAPNETKTVLVRILSSHSSALPLAVGYDTAFKAAADTRQNIVFVFTAVVLTIIALNVILMVLVDQSRLLWFPASQIVAVYSAWQINRFPYLLMDPPGREMSRFIDQVLTVGGILLLLQFARVFFNTAENTQRTDRFALGLIAIGGSFLALECLGLITDLYSPGFFVGPTTLVWLTCFTTLIWIAFSARLRRVPGSGWILLAWVLYGGIITYMVVESLTVLPPLPYQSDLILPLICVEAIMITYALGYFARRNMQERIAANDKAETALRRQVIALQDLADRSRLLLAMGHDGRNLLGGLNYLSDGIRESASLDDAKAYATRLKDVSTMLADMLNIMVDNASSGEGTHGPVVIEPVNVDTLLSTVRIVAGKAASQKGIVIRTRTGVEDVMTDHLRVFRILTNLVSNAGKYSHDGKILLTCRQLGNELRFQVFDQGIGLGEDEILSLLEAQPVRFDDSQPGEGVGLTICQEFAKELGGELRISSEKNRGSLFELCLPIAPITPSTPGDEKIRVGVPDGVEAWPGLAATFELVEFSENESNGSSQLDAILVDDKSVKPHAYTKAPLPVLVATFEKTSGIRARWAGKAAALIYSPVTAEAVIAALTAAGIKLTKRIKGADIDDAHSDRRRSRSHSRRSDVKA